MFLFQVLHLNGACISGKYLEKLLRRVVKYRRFLRDERLKREAVKLKNTNLFFSPIRNYRKITSKTQNGLTLKFENRKEFVFNFLPFRIIQRGSKTRFLFLSHYLL